VGGAELAVDSVEKRRHPFPRRRRNEDRKTGVAKPFVLQLHATLTREKIDLVPDFEDVAIDRQRVDAEIPEYLLDVLSLSFRLLVRDVAYMQDEIGFDDFFERCAESRDEHRRKIGNEAD